MSLDLLTIRRQRISMQSREGESSMLIIAEKLFAIKFRKWFEVAGVLMRHVIKFTMFTETIKR